MATPDGCTQTQFEEDGVFTNPWIIRLRKLLLMPFTCRWNAWVRDVTARLER